MRPLKDITGQKFGRLTVIKPVKAENGKTLWLCKCDCGNEIRTQGYCLGKRTFSCGCMQKEKLLSRITKHGKCHSRIYRIYNGMVRRCYSPNCKAFEHYGGRGITLCKEWKDSFDTFYDWAINNGYADNLTIERKNVNGDYEPDNCCWIEKKYQTLNMTTTHFVKYQNKTMALSELCRLVNVSPATVSKYEEKFNYDYDALVNFVLNSPHHKKFYRRENKWQKRKKQEQP